MALPLAARELRQQPRANADQHLGRVVDIGKSTRTLEERFWPKVDKGDGSGCWIWTGWCDPNGYGQLRTGGRDAPRIKAYRLAYELLVGPIPKGLVLDHLCRVPSCVRPDHLEPVTNRENILRGYGRAARNARKTHCSAGHPLSGANLRLKRKGARIERHCRICGRLSAKGRVRDRRKVRP